MEFFRPENWSRQPFLFLGDLPDRGIDPGSSALQVDSLLTELEGIVKNKSRRSFYYITHGQFEETVMYARS